MADTFGDDRITAKPTVDEGLAGDDIVRLVTAPNPAQAHIWEQMLREEGVPCRVVGDYLNAAIGDIPGLRAEVWIRQSDLARAQAILERLRSQSTMNAEDAEEENMPPEPGYRAGSPPANPS
jgi:hypothetical protein